MASAAVAALQPASIGSLLERSGTTTYVLGVIYLLTLLYLRQGDVRGAAATSQRLLERLPGETWPLNLRGTVALVANDANTAAAPAYTRVDLGAERRLRTGSIDWTGFVRIDNLFDRDIVGSVIVNDSNGRYFEPAPGRSWTVGLSARMDFD